MNTDRFQLGDEQQRMARRILDVGTICDECLGRAYGRIGRGYTNADRGRLVRMLVQEVEPAKRDPCWVCGDVFDRIDSWADRAVAMAEGWEHATYRFGVLLTTKLEQVEAYFGERFPTGAMEPLKHAVNRALGMAYERRMKRGTVSFGNPDLSFVLDLAHDELSMDVASVYLAGRYRKLVRGIPQTKWPCRSCRGRGCARCGYTGKQYAESVEEWIGGPLIDAARAQSGVLHGAGREDIDALMLGSGRPFVIEIVAPRVRALPWDRLAGLVNEHARGRVQVCGLVPATRQTVARAKTTASRKAYQVRVVFGREITDAELADALHELVGRIEQRTPRRVAHRRANLVRIRTVHRATGRLIDSRHAEIGFITDGGLYVKELVSGDAGRTMPNLSSRLGTEAVVRELDVTGILSDELSQGLGLDRCEWMDSA